MSSYCESVREGGEWGDGERMLGYRSAAEANTTTMTGRSNTKDDKRKEEEVVEVKGKEGEVPTEFDAASLSEEDVACLDVSVDSVVTVEIV